MNTAKITKEYLKKIDNEKTLIPLTYDFAFKRIFSKNKEALKIFLIKVLDKGQCEKIIGDMIEMSWEGFSLHEWEKEKLDALVEYETFEEGKETGQKEKSLEIAKNMLSKGMDIDTISEITKLSKEEIEALK